MQFGYRYRAKTGEWRWLSWVAVPEGGKLYSVTRDVTEEKTRQAELEAAQEQLGQAQKMEAVGQLTGGVAHDFNALLTGVIGSLDMMQRQLAKCDMSKMERYTTTAITSANRAAALTHRLLAFSRRQPLDPKPVSANRLVTGIGNHCAGRSARPCGSSSSRPEASGRRCATRTSSRAQFLISQSTRATRCPSAARSP